MIKLGIIGTGWITNSYLEGAFETGKYKLCGVYSRSLCTGKAFAEKYSHDIYCEDDLERFLNSDKIDAVYIGSPNSLHYEQAKTALLAGKHVIVEKPAFSNHKETVEMFALAEKQNVFLLEAAKHMHERNFLLLKNKLGEIGDILGANFTFMKYSSRADALKKGEFPNIFTTEYSGGAIMDLGVYVIYGAVGLFGAPKESYYFSQKLATGVDGIGTIILRYDGFDVTMQTGKIADAFLKNEIYGSEATLCVDSIQHIHSIEFYDRKEFTQIAHPPYESSMFEQANDFADLIINPSDNSRLKDYSYWKELAITVSQIITKLRLENDIIFPTDN